MSERCETCRYWHKHVPKGWVSSAGVTMWCYRFPISVQKEHSDWCGEWREREPDRMDPAQR